MFDRSVFTHIHQNQEDLVKKVQMMRLLSQKQAAVFNAVWGLMVSILSTALRLRSARNMEPQYHRRLTDYVKYVQQSNVMVVGGMTDLY